MIEAIDLTKRYEDGLLALDGLSLSIQRGEIYCLLGANGAGKTTTINLFLDFVQPTSGSALINGINVAEDPLEAKKFVSYVPENVMLYGSFTAWQNLEFFSKLGGKHDLTKNDYHEVLRRVGLQDEAIGLRLKQFSKGMRQKVAIAIAIVKDAPAILLDEPTSGLDPQAAAEFIEILSGLRAQGRAVLMSTHDIFRAKEIADRVGIMKGGRKVMERSRAELEHEDLQALYLDYMEVGIARSQPEIGAGAGANRP
jgi:ABC-2 type transport system ATP-binding protein